MKVNRLALCLSTLATVLVPVGAKAQGFGLNEIGSCAVARQGAVVAAPCNDASSIYWNPAQAARLRGFSLLVGAAAIGVGGDFTADTTGREYGATVPTSIPPHIFLNYKLPSTMPLGDRTAIGLGVYVPYGLTSQWNDDFPGRFSALKATLATIYIQPNIAIDVIKDRLAIGGGPLIGRSTVELRQAVDLYPLPFSAIPGATFGSLGYSQGTQFAIADVKGSATAYGFNVGAQAQLTKTLAVGVRWTAAMYFDYKDADATFMQTRTGASLTLPVAQSPTGYISFPLDSVLSGQFRTVNGVTGALTSQKASTHIKHPGQIQFGVGYTGLDRTSIGLDYEIVQWNAFDALPVTFKGPASASNRVLIEEFQNSWAVRGGIEHTFANRYANGWSGRAGYSYVRAPAPDVTVTPLLPDMNRMNYSLGLGIPFGQRYALDASYLIVDTKGRRGRIRERTSVGQTAEELNSGFYRLNANVLSLSLKAQY